MLELYQFELSHYCEKVRLILDYKGLPYRKVEVTPGIGQLEVFQLSGQRKVPVLKDGNEVIADSTAIADYLDRQYPEKPIIPEDPKLRGLTLLIEQWADESIGLKARNTLLSILGDESVRKSLLPTGTPDFLKDLVGSVPRELFTFLSSGIGLGMPDPLKSSMDSLKRDLTALTFMLTSQPYLVTDHPTLADFAVAAMTIYIKFPAGTYLNIPDGLKGKGVPGIADIGTFEPFFTWRDRLYADFRQTSSFNSTPSSSAPTSINID